MFTKAQTAQSGQATAWVDHDQVSVSTVSQNASENLSQEKERDPRAPPTMAEAGFPGLLGDVVHAACADSEAHPVAVAANYLAFYCAAIGRGPFQRIGDSIVHCRPYSLLVGRSGKARKGTSESTVREVFRRAYDILQHRHQGVEPLRIHNGGLSTGEGVAWAIRDAVEPDKNGKGGDPGVRDKRILVIESEFANVLAQCRREGNTLSATVRNLWDGRTLEPLTKTSRTRASEPHVVIVGHITGHELRERSTENDASNGLLNRFMVLHVHRPKLVADPQPTPNETLDHLALRTAHAIDEATDGLSLLAESQRELRMSAAARALWVDRYSAITQDRDGLAGSLMARSEVYARMLASVFALMAGRLTIEPSDFDAAFAWIDYWRASTEFVFLDGEDNEEALSNFDHQVLKAVSDRPGIKLSELNEVWHRHKIKEVAKSLEVLLNLAPPLIDCKVESSANGGRKSKRYTVTPHASTIAR
jgi:putative DNA primase/helicase